ncbi:putative F-box domain-containing protein [Rosa chinensis]|uniref:Putative F-box domain-containing protein n=1 Tax=Rosa chinensis TaxID=74649 RepID=A0A2P6PCY8_ROSCH|nr:uncharacterized protein LOC112177934 [Rosa chinensis]PRQ19797.1 putative F-box domain-containing protein [Rosa chinensis]
MSGGGDSFPAASKRTFFRALNGTSIDNLPDEVLIEILCRLPCYKFVSQCKFVSNRWCTLTSNPLFIRRFLSLQSDRKTNRTLINRRGEEFLNRMSSSSQPLSPLFKRIMSFHGLKEEPVVEGTYNDLVLCCASKYEQRDYYICNPYTMQWLPLPPPPQLVHYAPVGFTCDLRYYNCNKENEVQLNAEYRCVVVRLILPCGQRFSCKFKVQLFSSETGEWKESIVSSPSPVGVEIAIDRKVISPFAYKGMLFWGDFGCERRFLIGLDPFMINSTISTNGGDTIDHYKCRFIEFRHDFSPPVRCLGEYRGCLRMGSPNSEGLFTFHDLTEEETHGARRAIVKYLKLETIKNFHFMTTAMYHGHYCYFQVLAIDPNNEDILYVQKLDDELDGKQDGDIFRCNITTNGYSRINCFPIDEKHRIELSYVHFPLVVPWWPTPLPRLPQHMRAAHLNPQSSWNP